MMKANKLKVLTTALFSIYFLALVWLILFKLQFSIPALLDRRVLNLLPFRGSVGENGLLRVSEIRNNVIAFLPFGVYLGMLGGQLNFRRKVAIILTSTFVLEAIQFAFMIGRADITDVLSNTVGGIIGIGVYALAAKMLGNKTNGVLAIFAGVVTVLLVVLVGVLLANHRWIRIR